MRITFSVILTLLAYGLLYAGGLSLVPLLVSMFSADPTFGTGLAAIGLLLGGLGAAALFAALRLALPITRPVPFDKRKLMLAGLLFPGASQIYAGRWAPGVCFLAGPFAAFVGTYLTVLIVRNSVGAHVLPSWSSTALKLAIPIFYALLWLGSMSEAYFWAARQTPGIDATAWPRSQGVVATLGATLFLLPLIMVLLIRFMLDAVKLTQ